MEHARTLIQISPQWTHQPQIPQHPDLGEGKEPWEGKNYTSARLISKGKGDWQYGKIEVRARLPKGLGTWPAIWMLASTAPFNWPDDGEIDIMEHVGYNQGFIHGSVHTKKYNHVIGTQRTGPRMQEQKKVF